MATYHVDVNVKQLVKSSGSELFSKVEIVQADSEKEAEALAIQIVLSKHPNYSATSAKATKR